MSLIDAEGEFLYKRAVEALPDKEKQIYKDMVESEIYKRRDEKAITVVARKHGMTEKEVTECMLRAIELIEEYIESRK